MIEINLLPEEMRQTEGTPPTRLFTIIGGVVVACVLGVFISQYYFIRIPNMNVEIANRKLEIEELKKKEIAVKETMKKIETIKAKVATLESLIYSRIRYARLLDRLCDAMPDGAWFKSFSIQKVAGGGGAMGKGGGDKYQINFTGFTIGASELDRNQRLTDLMNNLEYHFRVVDCDPKTGLNNFCGAIFDRPKLTQKGSGTAPTPSDKDPRISQVLQKLAPKDAINFVMSLRFELPAKEVN
jgi:Tfp pilus assembly protein PilN